jgi:hypothetical protein
MIFGKDRKTAPLSPTSNPATREKEFHSPRQTNEVAPAFGKREPRPSAPTAQRAGSREPSCALLESDCRGSTWERNTSARQRLLSEHPQEEPKGVRAWNCRITAASIPGIEIANEVHPSGTQ